MKISHLYYIIPLFLLSCGKGHETDCFKGTGPVQTISVPLSEPFNRIEADGRIKLMFVQDSLNQLDITCGEKLIDGVDYHIENGTLYLDDLTRCHWVRNLNHMPLLTVHYTSLNYIRTDNFGENRFLVPHHGESITIEYWTGSGITYYTGYTDEVYFKVNAGSGAFCATGSSNMLYLYHAGGSRLIFDDFSSPKVYAHTLSNNDIHLKADSFLYGEIRRTGNILYKGSPTEIIRTGSGNGQIIPQ